ncbi:hypothetical protein JHK87_024312 [Glycine soja]|nr:hypothetical protein JHK87_024312 [Glycine soja]
MDLKENCTYVMHNFKVLKNNGQYRVCDHQFKLVFIGVTIVRECVLGDIPFRKYRFAGFADVVAGQFECGLLEVVFRQVSGKGRRVVFKLKDLRLAELGIDARSGFKSHGEGSTQLSGSMQLSSKESFFGKAEAKTIADINTISKDGDVDLNASLQALDKLLGHELAFKIKVQPKFRNSAVLKCSTDSSLINTVMDMLADAETSSKMDIPVSDSNLSAQHESQSLSVTENHDPLLGFPLTPTKRQAFQDCDDEAGTSQISPAQLSSNKLKKHAGI